MKKGKETPEEEAKEHGVSKATARKALKRSPKTFKGEETPEEEAAEKRVIKRTSRRLKRGKGRKLRR